MSSSTPAMTIDSPPVSPNDYSGVRPSFDSIDVSDIPIDTKPFLGEDGAGDERVQPLTGSQPGGNYIHRRRCSSINVLTARNQMMQAWNLLIERDTARRDSLEASSYKSVSRYENNAISQGILTMDDAVARLKLYREVFEPRFPAIIVPNEPIEKIMEDSPILFHCAIDVVSRLIEDRAATQKSLILRTVVYESLIKEIFIANGKKLELLQGIALVLFWYNEPEFFHRQHINSLSSIAMSLGFDLGIGGGQAVGSTHAPIFDQIVTAQVVADPEKLRCRQTWLSVYGLCLQPMSAYRRPMNDVWNNYTAESVQISLQAEKSVVSSSAGYVPIWFLAEATQIFQSIYNSIYREGNEGVIPDMDNGSVIAKITEMEARINYLCKSSKSSMSAAARIIGLLLRVSLLQGVLYAPYSEQVGRSPFTNFSLHLYASNLSPEASRYFCEVYGCAAEALHIFINEFDLHEISVMISPLYSIIVFTCSIVLKCRALELLNPYFSQAEVIREGTLQTVTNVIEKLNGVIDRFPCNNTAASYAFALKLLVCHHDATMYFLLYELGMKPIARNEFRQANEPPAHLNGRGEQLNLSDNATPEIRQPENGYTNGISQAPGSAIPPSFFEMDPFTFTNVDQIPNNPYFTQGDDTQPWQPSDDFWKDIIPPDFPMADF